MTEKTKTLNLHQRLQACRAAVRFVVKEKKKVNGQYFPLSYNAVVAACESHLIEQGISLNFSVIKHESVQVTKLGRNSADEVIVIPNGYVSTVEMSVICTNADVPTDSFSFVVVASAWHSLDKAPVIAQTFCKKEAYKAIFHLETYDDEADAPGESDRTPPAPEQYETISAENIQTLKDLAAKIGVGEDIVAKSADASYTRIEQIPVAKYQTIFDRMMKRAQQLGKQQGEKNE